MLHLHPQSSLLSVSKGIFRAGGRGSSEINIIQRQHHDGWGRHIYLPAEHKCVSYPVNAESQEMLSSEVGNEAWTSHLP